MKYTVLVRDFQGNILAKSVPMDEFDVTPLLNCLNNSIGITVATQRGYVNFHPQYFDKIYIEVEKNEEVDTEFELPPYLERQVAKFINDNRFVSKVDAMKKLRDEFGFNIRQAVKVCETYFK